VAFNAKWLIAPVEKFMGRPFQYLNFIGGGANSDVWSQTIADIFDRKIRQVKDPIFSNARGAAFLASIALKYITMEDIPKYIQIKAEYTPNPDNRIIYDELFKEFVAYYNSQKKACARMNKNKEGVCSI
jgi:xylulokinase